MRNFFLIILFAFSACSFPIDLEVKDFKSQLVAFAKIDRHGLELRLTRTIGLNESIPLDASILNATVQLYENDNLVGVFLITKKGANYFSYEFLNGQSYRIEIQKDGFDNLISESLLFQRFETSWNVNIQERSNLNQNEIGLLININRKENDSNIYTVDMDGFIDNQIVFNSFRYDRVESDFNSGCGVLQFRKYLFPNTCFQQENMFLPFTFNIKPAQIIGESVPDGFVDKVQIKVGLVGDSFYKYIQNAFLSERYFEDAFSEPLPEFTNFSGGFGVFYYLDEEVRILNLQ